MQCNATCLRPPKTVVLKWGTHTPRGTLGGLQGVLENEKIKNLNLNTILLNLSNE